MKTSLEHLPAGKQQEIRSIADSIVKLVKPEMVILFGSYSRGDWVEDRYKENGTTYEYKSDYDILVVTKKPKEMPPGLGKEVRRRVKKAENLQTTPHIIFHDIGFLNTELEDGHYFFGDIIKEGTMLYNTNNYELSKPKKLSGYQRAAKAKLFFDEWFITGNDFLGQYGHAVADKKLKIAIFELHQVAEKYYYAIELVFTDYKPKTHDLSDLNKWACTRDIRFKAIFPNQTEEEKRRFQFFVKAYIDSRYKLGYIVDPKDLQWLSERVLLLKELTEKICLEKIEKLTQTKST